MQSASQVMKNPSLFYLASNSTVFRLTLFVWERLRKRRIYCETGKRENHEKVLTTCIVINIGKKNLEINEVPKISVRFLKGRKESIQISIPTPTKEIENREKSSNIIHKHYNSILPSMGDRKLMYN